jgi:hypothetical protein
LALLAARVFAPLLLAPVASATGHLVSDRVEQGLQELAPELLRTALTLAIARLAEHASVRPLAVERLLPMSEVQAVLTRLGDTQPKALVIWRSHAGGLGGLLGRATEVPGEGRAAKASNRLASLADTMQRDKVVSEPLHALAEDVAAWEALVERLVAIVEGSKELRFAYRLHQAKVAAVVATIAAVIVVIAVISRALWVARAHVIAANAKEDPCAVLEVPPVELDRVSSQLRAQLETRRRACEQKRADEAHRIEEERLRKEHEEAVRVAKEKLEADCEKLAADVEAGKLTSEDEAFAKDDRLTARIADSSLEGRDFGPDDPKMPCMGAKAEPRLWESFRKAVLAKPWIMLVATAPSPKVRAAFVVAGAKMPFKLRRVLATRANDFAKFSIRSGKLEDATRASAWCDVARSVGMPMAGPCDSADKIVKPH